MTLGDVLAVAATSSVLLAVMVVLFIFVFRTAVARWIQHRFDAELEKLKAGLASQQSEIEALQRGALAGMAARNATLDKRRLEALERVWSAVVFLRSYESTLTFVGRIELEELSDKAKVSKELRDFIGAVMKGAPPIEDLGKEGAPTREIERERLFVPAIAWAMFDVYRALVLAPTLPLTVIRSGLDATGLLTPTHLRDVVIAALPHAAESFDTYGFKAFPSLAEHVRNKIFSMLIQAVDNPTSDKQNVEQAAKILHAVQQANSAKPITPPSPQDLIKPIASSPTL